MPDARRRIQLLLVDDSPLFLEALNRALSKDRDFEIVALAADPYEARDKIMLFDPDVMISDINMPKMNGVDFIRRLMAQYPIPIIVISSNAEFIDEAIRAGAIDGVQKPDYEGKRDFTAFVREVSEKVRFASKNDPRRCEVSPGEADAAANAGPDGSVPIHKTNKTVIAIGASTGGTDAIAEVVSALPSGLPGIVIVQHMPADFTGMFAERLNAACVFPVREAKTGDRVAPNSALVAPGNFQFKVVKGPDGCSVTLSSEGEKVGGHCPSVDVLFSSVAASAGPNAIGVILTGMGHDGAAGLLEMRRAGARTIGQDEKSSVVYGMPKTAYEKGAVQYQLPLRQIAARIVALL
ncbi:MAG: chemotaxis response regulator protein-glutamate methylesterase [Clostridiales bacterium]|jgi:two-component system chemotaxis response regulator CheB|nr:chemotaxis response regulator protein-glutamate methylesterase [Clostridiales bacterium]